MARGRFEAEEDEQVLLSTGPHWCRLVRRLLPATVLLAACVAGFVLWRRAPVWFGWVLLAGVAVALAQGLGRLLAWRSTSLVVTSARVVHRHGVLRRTGREIPVSRVQDVTYEQRLLERLLRIGSVTIESAGSGSAEAITGLPRPAEVQRLVNRAVEAAAAGRAGATRAGVDLAAQLERLDALRRRGVLSEAEFAAKKAELLGRR